MNGATREMDLACRIHPKSDTPNGLNFLMEVLHLSSHVWERGLRSLTQPTKECRSI